MIKIRKVTSEDSDLILEWRNNPQVFRYALNPNPIPIEEHQAWFRKKITDNNCIFFLGLYNENPCGSIRYQISKDAKEAEVSISISPQFWGKKIATELMRLAEENLKKFTSVEVIHATVLDENIASVKLFTNAGFKKNKTHYTKKI